MRLKVKSLGLLSLDQVSKCVNRQIQSVLEFSLAMMTFTVQWQSLDLYLTQSSRPQLIITWIRTLPNELMVYPKASLFSKMKSDGIRFHIGSLNKRR